jgi:TonB-dependent receptor-like protein/carboxypeptidase family protein
MVRQSRVLSAAGLAGVILLPALVFAQSQKPVTQTARVTRAVLRGVVSDERGGPLNGAMVSALGTTMAMAVTDEHGRFELDLPYGEYVLRAHLQGFAASRREFVRIAGGGVNLPALKMRRLDNAAAADPGVKGRTILSAGLEAPASSTTAAAAESKDDHPHSETAWRLRHVKRSILKDSAREVVVADNEVEAGAGSAFGRRTNAGNGNFVTSLFAELPFSGEVNLLTTSAFAPGEFVSTNILPRGVAYLSLGAPTPAGDWVVRAAMSDGDLASWIVSGSFVARPRANHAYTVGLTYSKQEYQGGNPAALAAVTDNSRNAGEISAFDRWRVSPLLTVDYGARYTRFDYLDNRNLLSPALTIAFEPIKRTRIIASATQQMLAPGAEEFLSSRVGGPWLPPERTFAPLIGGALRAERMRAADIGIEQMLADGTMIGIRRFHQNVDDQLATLFGLALADTPRSVGHYYVANLGAFDADGWAVRLSSPAAARVRAVIDYSLTQARWITRSQLGPTALWAPAAVRADHEEIHDITTSVHTDIPETATRVLVLYRINSAYTRAGAAPGLDGRFDVQVNQALPIGLAGTQWEVLVGLRNLFRDPTAPGSIYDELLVSRPPKRVVGGFLVRF